MGRSRWMGAVLTAWMLSAIGCGCGCGNEDWTTLATLRPANLPQDVPFRPSEAHPVTAGKTLDLVVEVGGVREQGLTWSARQGTVDAQGRYTAPPEPGRDRVEAKLSNGWILGLWLDVLPAPRIDTFTATPFQVPEGGEVTLRYTCTPGVRVDIRDLQAPGTSLHGASESPGQGLVIVRPRVSTTYQLKLRNNAGTVVQAEAAVLVGGKS